MADSGNDDSTAAWAGCFGLIAAVAAVLALGALVDPFAWTPSIADVWSDCEDIPGACASGEHDAKFGRALVNVFYLGLALTVLFRAGEGGELLREARGARFDGPAEAATYDARRLRFAWLVTQALAVAALPIVVAVAS